MKVFLQGEIIKFGKFHLIIESKLYINEKDNIKPYWDRIINC